MRIPDKWLLTEPGTRYVYVEQPLPSRLAGGGSVVIDGKEVPIHVYFGGTIDKRRLKRNIRRAAQRRI